MSRNWRTPWRSRPSTVPPVVVVFTTPKLALRSPGKVRGGQRVDDDMQIEIWSAVACPWCYVGTARFERAVAETGLDVQVFYRSFVLGPSVPRGEAGPPHVDYRPQKFGAAARARAAPPRRAEAARAPGTGNAARWETGGP